MMKGFGLMARLIYLPIGYAFYVMWADSRKMAEKGLVINKDEDLLKLVKEINKKAMTPHAPARREVPQSERVSSRPAKHAEADI
jgi:hypothetical protein